MTSSSPGEVVQLLVAQGADVNRTRGPFVPQAQTQWHVGHAWHPGIIPAIPFRERSMTGASQVRLLRLQYVMAWAYDLLTLTSAEQCGSNS